MTIESPDDFGAWIDDSAASSAGWQPEVVDHVRGGGLYSGPEIDWWDVPPGSAAPTAVAGDAAAAGDAADAGDAAGSEQPDAAPDHVWLWVPQALVRAPRVPDGETPRLRPSDRLLYLHLTALRNNQTLTHRLNFAEAARQCGLERRTVTASLKRLVAAGLVQERQPSRAGKGPLLLVPKPDSDARFNIPLALVWPVRGEGPRWGSKTAVALQTVLAVVAVVKGFKGGPTYLPAKAIAQRAGMHEDTYRDGLAFLLGAGAAGGIQRQAGEIERDDHGAAQALVRSVPGGWLTSTPRRAPRRGADPSEGRYLMQAASRVTVDWSRLPGQVQPSVPEVAHSAGSLRLDGQLAHPTGSGVAHPTGSEVAHPTGSGVAHSTGTKRAGTPVEHLPLQCSGAALLHARASASSRAGGTAEEDSLTTNTNPNINLRPAAHVAGKGKGAEDNEQDGRSSRAATPRRVDLRTRLDEAASARAAQAIVTEAAEAAGGSLLALSVEDQVAAVHAMIRYAPKGHRFALDAIDTEKVGVALRLLLIEGADPVAVGEAITKDLNDVRSPVAVLLGRIKRLEAHPLDSTGRLWPQWREQPWTGRLVDKPFDEEGYYKSITGVVIDQGYRKSFS